MRRISQWSLSLAHRILGIESPSRVWTESFYDGLSPEMHEILRRPPRSRTRDAPIPWYAARGPREAWESPELRDAARHVRRLIRRHWYELLFDYDGEIAWFVRIAMASPPKRPDSPLLLDAVLKLERLGLVPKINPGIAHEFASQCGIKWEGDAA